MHGAGEVRDLGTGHCAGQENVGSEVEGKPLVAF